MTYRLNEYFLINCGVVVSAHHIFNAIIQTNRLLADLPSTFYKSVDFKTTSSVVGSIFCDTLANEIGCFVNPIEKGHPDIIPVDGTQCTEEQLRNYPQGLEIKCTVGNIEKGANLRAGFSRIGNLTGITWQAHHREVKELLGLVWDFIELGHVFNFPAITGVFYSNALDKEDWGAISGTTGRNTKVTGMLSSGKRKMGHGWIAVLNRPAYVQKYSQLLNFALEN
jgi:hypothetical protein